MTMVAAAYVGGSFAASGKAELSPQEHESWRIALYYYYIDIDDISQHIAFHKELCDSAGFQGRIRISAEGINGVLSGLFSSQKNYEASLINELERISNKACDDLDMKYCQLRTDLPVEVQLFDSLSVKETGQVVSLFESDYTPTSQTNSSGRRSKQSNRRRRRKEQRKQGHEEDPTHPQLSLELQQQIMNHEPSPHLKADEWNAKLQEHVSSKSNDALLLDLRNVYESRVGHFAIPHVPTMLTNTRKYSDLPYMLASNKELQEKKEIFMYCTGGVRCERVSMFLQSIYPNKSFYQLDGGIQNYLKDSLVPEFYKGKNFVFDPRRTDPVHFGSTVGKCIVCDGLHDDYDNGHAPSENKEARCNTCRMLILVCTSCRASYKCWGEKEKRDDTPLLYCGKDRCVHEGVAPEPEIIRPWESDIVDVPTTD
jgi:predicted sulfurtransferase